MTENKALNWDDVIEVVEEKEFILLDPGEYNFTVVNFEREQYNGNADGTIEPSPQAALQLEVETPEGKAIVFERLILHKDLAWKLSQFFISIGQQKDEAITMDWNRVLGATGRMEIHHRKSTKTDKVYANVKRFLPPAEPQTSSTPSW